MKATYLTVIAPTSLRVWYAGFADPYAPLYYLGVDEHPSGGIVGDLAARVGRGTVVFLSSHESLQRDRDLAQALGSRAVATSVQSAAAVRAARDKLVLKRMLDANGLPTPDWAPDPRPGQSGLLKRRCGTQSEGLAWAAGRRGDSDHYWERFVAGTEYSVVIHRTARLTQVYPPVWKGETRRDLEPPWRRLRVCPVPSASAGHVADLEAAAARLAELLDIEGFAEVEFVVDREGTPLILEVNPRICGTLRLVAMATTTRVFDPSARHLAGVRPQATRFAAEVPHDGPPLLDDDVIATSRLTVAGDTPSFVRRRVERHAGATEGWPEPW